MINKGKLFGIIFAMLLYYIGLILVILGFVNILDSTFWEWFPLIWWIVIFIAEIVFHYAFIEKLEAADEEYNRTHAKYYTTGSVSIDSNGRIHDSRDTKQIKRDNAGWFGIILSVFGPVVFPVDSIIQLVKCIRD